MNYFNNRLFRRFLLFLTIGAYCGINSYCQLFINEIFATNASADLDKTSYNYINWIEIYNGGATSVNLYNYYLSDDILNLKKWRFQSKVLIAKGFYTVFADGTGFTNHTNFKLSADGGTIILSNSSGQIIDKVTYYKQYYNFSSGRKPDGSATWYYFLNPTNSKSNTSQTTSSFSGSVNFKTAGGFYSVPIDVELTSSIGTGEIYYSLDGSEPNQNSLLYTLPVSINANSMIRARVIESGKLPGAIKTQTYFISERKSKLPVVSLVTAPRNLWDDTIGIYVAGTNGLPGYCADTAKNWNQDWERAANFELFDSNRIQMVNQPIGTKLMGGCSRLNPEKSMVISARSKYGKGKLDYKFFPGKPFQTFNGICIRNSGNDFYYTMLRDAMMQTLNIGRMDLEYQADQPVSFYLNGQYWGMIDIRERSNEDMLTSNFGIDENNIDLLEYNGSVICGSGTGYNAMTNYIGSNNMAHSGPYNAVASQMDIDDFINYEIFEIYINNGDWPGNNIKYWRIKNPLSKWRWIIYDTDFGYGLYNSGPDFNTLHQALDSTQTGCPNPSWSTFLLRKLLENPVFKTKFINKFYAHMNTTFETNRVIHIIDSMQNRIADEMSFHLARWGSDIGNWNSNVEVMRNFARQRSGYMRQFLKSQFMTGEDQTIYYHSNIPGLGHITVNGVTNIDSAYSGIFPSGAILDIKFVPNDGYKFVQAYRNKNASKLIKLIKSGDLWKYNDLGLDLDTAWRNEEYNDSSWTEGKSELGYGDGAEATVVSYGGVDTNKYVTTYFRKSFDYDTTNPIKNASLRLVYDDGAVIYLNGVEILRVNMPPGHIGFDTLAYGYNGSVEDTFYPFFFDPGLLKNGKNVFAVEMHQYSRRSSDISFNLELLDSTKGEIINDFIYKSNIIDTVDGNITYTAYYEPVEPLINLVINEIAPINNNYADENGLYGDWVEILNVGNDTIDMAGLFFSEDLNKSLKWKVPFGFSNQTKIEPGKYKIFWADNNIFEGPLHMNFKLNKGGEALALLQVVGNDTNVIDEFTYGPGHGLPAYGRIPNGTGNFKWLFQATPCLANVDVTGITAYNKKPDNNPVDFFYDFKLKTIQIVPKVNLKDTKGMIRIYESTGRVIYNGVCDLNTETSVQYSGKSAGVYIIQLISKNYSFAKKIVIN